MSQGSESFKHELAEALPHWVEQDLVTQAQAEGLRAHYGLDALAGVARDRMSGTLFAIGTGVIGLGLLSFVAAQWAAIPPVGRVLGAAVLMLLAYALGWRWTGTPEKSRWGDVALVLCSFLWGATLALFAQWQNLSGDGGGLFLAWGLGVLAIAWPLRHAPSAGVAAIALLGVGLSKSLMSGWPWLFVLGVLPLAYVARATWLQLLCTVAVAGIAGALGADGGGLPVTATLLLLGAGGMGVAALARSRVKPESSDTQAPHTQRFVEAHVTLGLLMLGVLLSFWSYQDVWQPALWHPLPWSDTAGDLSLLTLLGVALLAAVGGAWRCPDVRRPLGVFAFLSVALLFLQGVGFFIVDRLWLAWPANFLLLATGLYLSWLALAAASRARFWLGVLLVTAQVGARFIEFDAGLIAKALAFTAWGVLLLVLGRYFEARRGESRA